MKDVPLAVGNGGWLSIKETRQIWTSYSGPDDEEGAPETRTRFHWMISLLSSKIPVADLTDDNKRDQEVYDVEVTSHGHQHCYSGFKTREDALKNALEFAERNGIEIDGYTP